MLKKIALVLMLALPMGVFAQNLKFGHINAQEIVSAMPEVAKAQSDIEALDKQLTSELQRTQEEFNKKYQSEVEVIAKEAQKMFQDYQAQSSTLSAAQKTKKEDEIVAKEKSAAELKRKYFGPEGELAKMQEKLINPIQDEIYGAVKELSQLHGYDLVLDRASAAGIIFANPRIDISDEVLRKLGYSN